jgi:hypothetical protein
VSGAETWFDSKYRVKWTSDKKLVEVHKGPIQPKDKPIASFSRKMPPSRRDSIRYALRAIENPLENGQIAEHSIELVVHVDGSLLPQ